MGPDVAVPCGERGVKKLQKTFVYLQGGEGRFSLLNISYCKICSMAFLFSRVVPKLYRESSEALTDFSTLNRLIFAKGCLFTQ